jgi:phenylacetate-coenzyme A ligase PaaK-like adenylate-forming protein
MGYECKLGHMHVNADWIIFEPVNANHEPVPAGQLSDRTLITNLANRVMPIIRYELGDRVTLSPQACTCGITLPVVNVEGRTDEILRFQSTAGKIVPVLPLALWSVLKETPGVLKFQAIQTAGEELKIRMEAKHAEECDEVWKRVYGNASDYLQKQGLENVRILRAAEPPVRDPKSGKFRNVWVEKVNSQEKTS